MKRKKNGARKKGKDGCCSVSRAGLAYKQGFYLETAWILSQMFEKKTKSILKKFETTQTMQGYSFEQSIKRIKYHHLAGKVPQLITYLDLGLIEEMRNWKNTRNTMLKDMVSVHVSKNRMERLASEGITLYKRWNKSVKQVKAELKNPGNQTLKKVKKMADEG
jgi:hypothetical protein